MKYDGVIISDIHFGATNPDELKLELKEGFIKYIDSLKKLDYIIIDGDYFDHKIYLNERTSDYAMSFMETLVNIAKEKNSKIRIIYGTESHEVSQYNIFSIYLDDKSIDFKIIYTVESEELFPDFYVLYIPEEYIYSKKKHYGEFFSHKYNYVFGHGTIQEVMTHASRETKKDDESEKRKVPIFTTSELINICDGQVYFGHYHIMTNIADKVFYVGSYSRWIFGEDEPKGFYHVTYDSDKNKYSQKFIENSLAKKFITYTYGYDSHVMDNETTLLEELTKRDKLTEGLNGDHVRYIFNIPENHPNPEFIMNILNERYRYEDNIKVQVTNGYVEKKKRINKKELNDVMDKYPMIFDKSEKLENKIIYFIKKKMDRDIPLEVVQKILYE